MDELTKRQSRYLRAALKSAPVEADRFYAEEVGASLHYSADESRDIAATILKEFAYFRPSRDYTISSNCGDRAEIPNPRGTGYSITYVGREAARQVHDDERQARKERRWKFIAGAWALLVPILTAIVIKLVTANLEKRLDRLEKTSPMKLSPTTK